MKLRIHSMVDVICNSSTTVYTYSDLSATACKKMLGAILKAMGYSEHTMDEMFTFVILADQNDYENYLEEEGKSADVAQVIKDVLDGAEKPTWMEECDEQDRGYECGDGKPGNSLYIVPKDPVYAEAAQAILNFLYSTDYQEISC